MKLRESLTDVDQNGTTLTIPYGISRYPNNLLYGILNIISGIVFVLYFGILIKPHL